MTISICDCGANMRIFARTALELLIEALDGAKP